MNIKNPLGPQCSEEYSRVHCNNVLGKDEEAVYSSTGSYPSAVQLLLGALTPQPGHNVWSSKLLYNGETPRKKVREPQQW